MIMLAVPTKFNAAIASGKPVIVGRSSWVCSRLWNVDVRQSFPALAEAARVALVGVKDVLTGFPNPVTYGPRRFTLRKGRISYANRQRSPIS